ncbi:TetR family transcriptional regulator (plasmid) [Arthrobacter sp. TMP15]|uniref:TetR/AcrR family transcriptional regulator n=1 Tax=Arthrobacter sp. TMP15 TaxID=3140789 RepID=UPI0031BA82F9
MSPYPATSPTTSNESVPVRPRDAVNTRALLLHAARRRFARDGYAGTTVRDIASDAGVNVALINRYFTSKEGLFEACLIRAAEELERPDPGESSIEDVVQSIVSQVANTPSGEDPYQLLLLLRSSGDEKAEHIQQKTLRYFSEQMASIAGWQPDGTGGDQLLLRAQIALSTALGVALLRSSAALEPIASATAKELTAALGDVFNLLLSPPSING